MTDHLPIQRWTKIFTRYLASEVLPNENGEYVTYADHLAAIRACERRVAVETEAAMMESFRMKPSPPHDQHYFADNICAYCVGRSEDLSAAREAVNAVQGYDHLYYPSQIIIQQYALAAIDALREDRQTPPPLPPSVGVPERRWT